MSTTPSIFLEVHIDRTASDIQISARGSRGEQLAARTWSTDFQSLTEFASTVRKSAAASRALDVPVVAQAQLFQKSLLDGEVGVLFSKLEEAAQGLLLVRLFMHDPELRALPWESFCKPGESFGFWGTSPNVLPVRGVMSSAPWQPREVRGAVRVLAIAPTGSAGLANLKQALADRLASGEIEWLEPIEGGATRVTSLFDRLRREPIPHVIHFLGHGRVENGVPQLRLADDDEEESWVAVELLAQQLSANFQGMLRLVILEACEGANPGALGSAAEILARAGADGVIAHLWPVKAEAARTCSAQFYRALAGSDRNSGDIASALNEARRAILTAYDTSAEAFSPVLYLRGPSGQIFHFKGRKVAAQVASVTTAPAQGGDVPGGLTRIMRAPFSLVLGNHWSDDQAALDAFRDKLQKELAKLNIVPSPGLPLSTLAEWFSLRRGPEKLGSEFQKIFRASMEAPAFLAPLAKVLCPGVHTTMLRSPWLEQALAAQQPERTIYVFQPNDDGITVSRRAGGADEWEEMDDPPTDIDVDKEVIILRPCRGYTADQVFTRPLLTDDDFSLRMRELWNGNLLSADLINAMLRTLGRRPALMVGMSLDGADHRLLLHHLFPRGVPRDTLAIVDLDLREGKLWSSGAGLPGRDEGVEVVETSADGLLSALENVVAGGAS